MSHIQTIVIHMAGSARRPAVDAILEASPYPAAILDAVDGRRLSAAEQARYRKSLLSPHYPFQLSASEIGCFLSHRQAWRRIADGTGFGLVFEDDARIVSDRFWQQVELAARTAQPSDVVRFPLHAGDPADSIAVEPTRRPGLLLQASLIGSEAAARLLELTEQFDRPVDTYLQMVWQHGVRTLVATPSLITEASGELGGSLIRKRKTLTQRLHREIARPIYRALVAIAEMRTRP